MSTNIQDTAKLLMQLHALEERLGFFEEQGKDCGALEREIDSLRAQVAAPHLARHDRLRAQGKRSVAECRSGVCSGCHMRVATGQVPEILRHETVQTCEHCGRFLYVSEKQPAPAPAPAAEPRKRKSAGAKPAGNRPRLAAV